MVAASIEFATVLHPSWLLTPTRHEHILKGQGTERTEEIEMSEKFEARVTELRKSGMRLRDAHAQALSEERDRQAAIANSTYRKES